MTGDALPKRSGPPGWLCWVPLASLLAAELYVRDYDGWGAWASAPLLFVPGLIALPLVVWGLLDCATAVRRHEPYGVANMVKAARFGPLPMGLLAGATMLALAASADLTEEQMREMGATDAEILMLKGLAGPPRREGISGRDIVAAGPSSSESLTRLVSSRGDAGLELAREVLFRNERASELWPDYAVFNGLANTASAEGLDLLRAAIARFGPDDPRWKYSRAAWASCFFRRNGPTSIELAASGVADVGLSPEDRGLYLFVLGSPGRTSNTDAREQALGIYRPYLDSGVVEIRRAAVVVARSLWDYDALAPLQDAAFSSTDLLVSNTAYMTALQLLQLGPAPDSLRKDAYGAFQRPEPYDPAEYEAWRGRLPEWKRHRDRFTTGEPEYPERSLPAADGAPRVPTGEAPSYEERVW